MEKPLLLTSSGNPLVKSKGLLTLLLTARVEEGLREDTRGLPGSPPAPDFKRRVLQPETLEDAFSSVHKSLGVPLRDPLLCTGRKRSSSFVYEESLCS